MARPRKTIDESRIAELAQKGYTAREIAVILGLCEDTLYRRFSEALHRGRELRNGALRSKQVEVALAGNVPMLIWLGKQLLGQREKVEEKVPIVDGDLPVGGEFARHSSGPARPDVPKTPKPN